MEPSFSHAQGGGGGVTLPVTVAQNAFNNTQLIGTDMPNLVGDLTLGKGYDNISIGLESYDDFGLFDGNPYVPDPSHYALASLTTGCCNTAIGSSALMSCTTGSDNVGVGLVSLMNVTTGSSNVAIGHGAGKNVTTGSNNVLLGRNAGVALASGTENFLLGTGSSVRAEDATGAIAIGIGVLTTTGQCVIGNESGGSHPVAIGFGGATAPADGDIANGQGFLYWDFSGSDVVLKFKGKAADGTVISKTVTVS